MNIKPETGWIKKPHEMEWKHVKNVVRLVNFLSLEMI